MQVAPRVSRTPEWQQVWLRGLRPSWLVVGTRLMRLKQALQQAREELMRNRMQSSSDGKVRKRGVPPAVSDYAGTEEELVAAAKHGDEGAFATLVKRHKKKILALALRYTRVREDAEDVVQQTFHKALVYGEKFEGKSSFATWLTRIAINEALMLLRKRRALREEFINAANTDDPAAQGFDMPDGHPNPEVAYLQREHTNFI